jgi:hypothetical protein
MEVPVWPRQKLRNKLKSKEWGEGGEVTQVVEHLPSKCKVFKKKRRY